MFFRLFLNSNKFKSPLFPFGIVTEHQPHNRLFSFFLFNQLISSKFQIVSRATSLPTPVYVAEGYAQRGRDVFNAEWVFYVKISLKAKKCILCSSSNLISITYKKLIIQLCKQNLISFIFFRFRDHQPELPRDDVGQLDLKALSHRLNYSRSELKQFRVNAQDEAV